MPQQLYRGVIIPGAGYNRVNSDGTAGAFYRVDHKGPGLSVHSVTPSNNGLHFGLTDTGARVVFRRDLFKPVC